MLDGQLSTEVHQRVGEALHDGALRLAERLGGVPPSAVRQVPSVLRLRTTPALGNKLENANHLPKAR